ncbi:ComEC/Rec2 family competence protein, partial [candidate division WOR-3 bacterium]|nr:ComEC/Rec2 family competence protein [candidate division WOR-3 bacterium]
MEPDLVGRRVTGRGMRHAAVTALAAMAAGILVQRVAGPPWWLMLLPVAAGAALAHASRGWSLLAALAGAAGLLALAREAPPVPEDFYRQERFRGCVVEELPGESRRAVVELDSPLRGRCLVWLDQGVVLRAGERIEVCAPIARFSYPRNPGVFDRNDYYRRRGFVGQTRASRFTVRRLARQPGWRMPGVWLAGARRWVRRVFQGVLGGERAAVMAALLLGERGGLEESTSRLFTDAGVLHVLAVSGLHVGIVAGLFW